MTGAFGEDLDRTYLGYEPTSPFATSWSGTTPAANTIPSGTGVDLADDFSQAMRAIEMNGFEVTGAVTHPYVKHLLRNMRDLNNQPIFAENLRDGITGYSVFGIPICFTRQVQQQASPAGYEILLAYTRYLIIGDRTGLQVSQSNEATLTQGTEPDINLFEMDMTAVRFVIRKGWVVKDANALAKVTGVV